MSDAANSSDSDFDPVVLVSARGAMRAEFVPAAGMLCSSLRCRGVELLDPREGVAAYARRGETMGIPLLYPWANRLARHGYRVGVRSVALRPGSPVFATDRNGLPIHGVIPGAMRWTPGEVSSAALSASLSWETPELLEVFPFRHRLRYEAHLGEDALEIALEVVAGEEAVPVSFGFHPYLAIADSERSSWRVKLPASERMVLDEHMIPTGVCEPLTVHDVPLADTSWDDAFRVLAAPARYVVRTGDRAVTLELLEGYGYAQVYSPRGARFVCFEPMTSPINALGSGKGLSFAPAGGVFRGAFRVHSG